MEPTSEKKRLQNTFNNTGWKRWGPYLSERQWGTVREDYSDHGNAWQYFTFDDARSRAYRWGEDGIGGISDTKQRICIAHAFWNGKDPFIKERLFGLTNGEGNHGEDVKEYYYYLDSTPTHSYMKMLYKYPQNAFPYDQLREENARRSKYEGEYELMDTGIFEKDEYFDIYIEYAKASEEDILVQLTIHNRAEQKAALEVLPHFWFRNTWYWGYEDGTYVPALYATANPCLRLEHQEVGNYYLFYEGTPELLFCENETNRHKLFGQPATTRYPKDSINDYVITGNKVLVNPELRGTKASLRYKVAVKPDTPTILRFRLSNRYLETPFINFNERFAARKSEADDFYNDIQAKVTDPDLRRVQRQAYGGMLWNKQYYNYNVDQWLRGDPASPPPAEGRKHIRNTNWRHLHNSNVISMPDKWEYPWYAAWDLAFHCVALAKVDAAFAKRQLIILLREYYMHPNGQIPAYEWNFSDVNPPVHAWGAWKVYCIDKENNGGKGDTDFLATVFHKLLMNFTWWVNQKDREGNNLFEGGFLGMDNIGVFDRSHPLPTGGYIEQADGSSWMAMYSLNMMRIGIELAQQNATYEEMASKFFEHFLAISKAIRNISEEEIDLWDPVDEFYYDALRLPNGQPSVLLKVRSLVSLTPLFAVEVLTPSLIEKLPDFTRRLEWVLKNRPDLARMISRWHEPGKGENRMLALVRIHRMKCTLRRMLDETEFLSEYGIRSLSRHHRENPYVYGLNGTAYSVKYTPGESDSSFFGGNSNWRGPIWFPVNYLIIESLHKFYEYYGDEFTIEYPTRSKRLMNLKQIAEELSARLVKLFRLNEKGERPCFGDDPKFHHDPHFKDHILFYEYFHGETGKGLGASHQTGWTGLIIDLMERCECGTTQRAEPASEAEVPQQAGAAS
jgi:hypothetical protein